MNSSDRWTGLKQRYWTALASALLIVACVLILLPRQNDFLELYREVIRFAEEDVLGMYSAGTKAPAYTKGLKLIDLKHMLATGSPALRASAVQALGDKREDEVLAPLIQLLNDTELVDFGVERQSISELSKTSLTRFIRARIVQEPGNINILIPYLSGTLRGTPLQRSSMIDILGDIKEPLARPILTKIAENEEDDLVRSAAKRSLAKIDSNDVESSIYSELRANQRRLVVVMTSLVCVLLLSMLYQLRKGQQRRLALLALVPALICAGFAVLVATEYSRGTVNSVAVDRALREGNIMIARTAGYHDQTEFPGDSYLARHLVKMGDARALRVLGASNSIEPDDIEALKRMTEVRRDWVLARMLSSRLGGSGLMDMVRNDDSGIRLAVVTALDKLMITNDEIVEVLELLTNDDNEEVRNRAAEVLVRNRNYPKWLPQAL
jgi:HEAT repeat protein